MLKPYHQNCLWAVIILLISSAPHNFPEVGVIIKWLFCSPSIIILVSSTVSKQLHSIESLSPRYLRISSIPSCRSPFFTILGHLTSFFLRRYCYSVQFLASIWLWSGLYRMHCRKSWLEYRYANLVAVIISSTNGCVLTANGMRHSRSNKHYLAFLKIEKCSEHQNLYK